VGESIIDVIAATPQLGILSIPAALAGGCVGVHMLCFSVADTCIHYTLYIYAHAYAHASRERESARARAREITEKKIHAYIHT
jgi:amino acid permease